MTLHRPTGHSAVVRMTLRLGREELSVAQMGPDFLILKEPAQSTSGTGTVFLSVDGVVEEIPVRLPQGIDRNSKRVRIAEVVE